MPNLKQEPCTSSNESKRKRKSKVSAKQKDKKLIDEKTPFATTTNSAVVPLQGNAIATTTTTTAPVAQSLVLRANKQLQKQNQRAKKGDKLKTTTTSNSIKVGNYGKILSNNNTIIKVHNYTGIYQQVTKTMCSTALSNSSTLNTFTTLATATKAGSSAAGIGICSSPTPRTVDVDVHMKVFSFGNAQMTTNNLQRQHIQKMLGKHKIH